MKFFWIPATDSTAAEQELNQFLAMHRVVHVEKTFKKVVPGFSPSQRVYQRCAPPR